MAAQEKVPIPEQELAKDLLSIKDRPTSASLASPFFSSTLADFTSCAPSTLASATGAPEMCDTVKRSYHMHMMVIGLEHQARDKEESTHQVNNVMFVEVDERLGHTHQNVATPAKGTIITEALSHGRFERNGPTSQCKDVPIQTVVGQGTHWL